MSLIRRAYLGLGSNLNDPRQQIETAIARIQTFDGTKSLRCANLYQTSPVGDIQQNDFINTVIAIDTLLSPIALLAASIRLEQEQGRKRTDERWGPRIIDCDLLWMVGTIIQTDILTLPHPEMENRLFVLVPLAELAPDFVLSKKVPIQQRIDELTQANQQLCKMISPD